MCRVLSCPLSGTEMTVGRAVPSSPSTPHPLLCRPHSLTVSCTPTPVSTPHSRYRAHPLVCRPHPLRVSCTPTRVLTPPTHGIVNTHSCPDPTHSRYRVHPLVYRPHQLTVSCTASRLPTPPTYGIAHSTHPLAVSCTPTRGIVHALLLLVSTQVKGEASTIKVHFVYY